MRETVVFQALNISVRRDHKNVFDQIQMYYYSSVNWSIYQLAGTKQYFNLLVSFPLLFHEIYVNALRTFLF